MKVLFYYRGRESLGIEYLSSVLRMNGHETELIFDPGVDNTFYWRSSLLGNLNPGERMYRKAREFQPDLLAFSSTTNEFPFVRKIAARLKEITGAPVIVGGIQPTSLPEHVISDPSVDMICRGEGELALLELADRMASGRDVSDIRNLWVKRSDGSIVRNPVRPLIEDLDSLPYPDKEPFYRYGVFKGLIQVMTGRGCPFNCSYCHNHFARQLYRGNGRYIRRRSPAGMIDELEHYLDRYPVKGFSFQDDVFLMNREWIEEFASMYRSRINIPFSCNAFPATMDRDMVRLLKEMGCSNLFSGIDSGSEKLRREVLHRNTPVEQIRRNMCFAREYGIPVELSAVFCFPGETVDQMWETVDLVNELKPAAVQAHILFPFPGTEVLRICRETEMVDDETEKRINDGEGSIVEESLLAHPHRDLAYVLCKLLAVYVKLPQFLKPVFRKLMTPAMKPFANFIFLATIPIAFPWQGITRLRELFEMLRKSRKVYAPYGNDLVKRRSTR